MHAMQTSGNCVRNITTDQWAGVAADEIEDPRIWAEVLRQHSTMHPEFTFLPRKFKIAITAAAHDRAAVKVHDIGLRLIRNGAGEVGFEVMVGGGLGRTPFIGKVIKPFLPKRDLLTYVEAVLRVYNQYGRRDNIYKARIKILVHELGAEKFAAEVENGMGRDQGRRAGARSRRGRRRRRALQLSRLRARSRTIRRRWRAPARRTAAFAAWLENSVANHKQPGYAIVTLSLKPTGAPPGDATAEQMDAIADLADRYSFGEIRVGHEQNLVLPHVAQKRSARALAEARSARAGDAECRARLRHHRLPGARLLQPRQCALDPGRAGADASASATMRWRAPSAACTSIFPAASMPAATITSATSAFSASRRTARSSTRSRSAAAPTRAPRSARCSGRRCATARSPTSSRTWSPPMSNCASAPEELFIDTVKRIGVEPFKERVYAAR